MKANYNIYVKGVDYDSHEAFKVILKHRGFALSGQQSKAGKIQNAIYAIGLKDFLKNPDKILDEFKGD